MLDNIATTLNFLPPLFLFISSVIIIWNWGSLDNSLKILGFFLFLGLITEILARVIQYSADDMRGNNLPLLHFYTLAEFLLLSLFYKSVSKMNPSSVSNFQLFCGIITGLIILNTLLLQPINEFNSNAKTLVQIIVICYAVLYFYNLPDEENIIYGKSIRLINSAIIVYYSGSLFVFMFSNYFYKYSSNTHRWFWAFNVFLYLIFQLLILFALWKVLKNKKSFSS